MHATPLPVLSEMLFTHWSAAFCSPQQHELASSDDRFTVLHDQSVMKLLVGRLRGLWSIRLWSRKLWNVHLHSSFQHADVLDHDHSVDELNLRHLHCSLYDLGCWTHRIKHFQLQPVGRSFSDISGDSSCITASRPGPSCLQCHGPSCDSTRSEDRSRTSSRTSTRTASGCDRFNQRPSLTASVHRPS